MQVKPVLDQLQMVQFILVQTSEQTVAVVIIIKAASCVVCPQALPAPGFAPHFYPLSPPTFDPTPLAEQLLRTSTSLFSFCKAN